MIIPQRNKKKESLVEYAERLSEVYSELFPLEERKKKGQIFTPNKIASFMADQFVLSNNSTIDILDPGAGVGILVAATCQRVLDENIEVSLNIDVYETDKNILPFLKALLDECKTESNLKNCNFKYKVFNEDFILSNESYFKGSLFDRDSNKRYDLIISNPPYFKLRKNSPQAVAMDEIIYGQPNIYALFMTMATNMSKPGGEIVFIVPRSFCSGLYYKKFRKWLLDRVTIKNIHIFESRKEVFQKDQILQENIILKTQKNLKDFGIKKEEDNVNISVSQNSTFDKLDKFDTNYSNVVYRKKSELFIRIPSSIAESQLLKIIDTWPNVLKDLNLKISTGPVVPFRAKYYLKDDFEENPKCVPLLWMHNIQEMKVVWPKKKNKKASAIILSDIIQKILVPVKNYVLVGRFSSKEQKRRLYAGTLFKSDFPYESIGIENHLNYIYKTNGELSELEALGITALLNTCIIDKFFRSINGNTQVNATEIRILPLPNMEIIKKIGEKLVSNKGLDLDKLVIETTGIEKSMEFDINLLKALEVD